MRDSPSMADHTTGVGQVHDNTMLENPVVWFLTGRYMRHRHFVKWLSDNDTTTRGQGRDDTRVFLIWVVMKFKFATLIRVAATLPNRATKLKFHHDPNRDNSCVVPSRLDATGTTT